jgi:translation initiation factor 1 (eIF-1/SUI1)
MATTIYDSGTVTLVDGTELYATPLKIKYLREFMNKFEDVKKSRSDAEAVSLLLDCVLVAMKQYHPIIKTIEQLEDVVDLPGVYSIIDFAAGIKMKEKTDDTVVSQAVEGGSTWNDLDLAKLESEVFLVGIWKDYEELEMSLSMPEMLATLNSKRDAEYQERKFLAAIQGVDLDKESRKEDPWEAMKARVFSGGRAKNSNDVTALQGMNAQKAGFGIGMGLDYVDMTKK